MIRNRFRGTTTSCQQRQAASAKRAAKSRKRRIKNADTRHAEREARIKRRNKHKCEDHQCPMISFAETREPLRIVNRSGNQTSEDGAASECDGVADYLENCGFRKIVFRGDTAFSQTQHLDRWNKRDVTFYFGYKAKANIEELAENLAKSLP